ncbi:hypothetical protein LCGC14_1301630 [marine sediment metagenome]|uniref:Helix-turn-helix type 11 domain-containing protein n=1 Tax=marine sediment metagenome TaxID=412755 RepID=A0A0F9LA37_9ZZZZ
MNIETRISTRARSIFKALGEIVNDFYLEVGIYFIGCFNALLVAWELYTEMVGTEQPQTYAIAIALVAFIAVEGLTIFLVGAAAKTDSTLLWFFSVVFAMFFTYSHYQANGGNGNMGQYISLAIPIFAVVGYMARTMKATVENTQAVDRQKLQDVEARTRKLEDDRLIREQKAEDVEQQNEADEQAHEREMDRFKLANAKEVTLAKIAQKPPNDTNFDTNSNTNDTGLSQANNARKLNRQDRLDQVLDLSNDHSQAEIARLLDVSVSTIKRDIKQLNGKMEVE